MTQTTSGPNGFPGWKRAFGLLVALSWLVVPAAAAPFPAEAVNGQAVDYPGSRAGFLVYFEPLGVWVDPDVFWYRWADSQKAFLWNGAAETPEGPEVEDGHMFIIETDAGPCLLIRHEGRWRRAGEHFGWSEALRGYGGCPSLDDRFGAHAAASSD